MLTRDLVRAQVKGRELVPTLLAVQDFGRLERARDVLDLFAQAREERWRRGEIAAALEALIGEARDARIVRGLAKVLEDQSEYSVESSVEPSQIRNHVFTRAAELGPLALDPGVFQRPVAQDILREVAERLQISPEEVVEGLYADLHEEQRIQSVPETLSPEDLLHRYNVAQITALLLHAESVRVRLFSPTPQRLRQLLRYAKFFQLIHDFSRDGEVVTVALDGPASLLGASTRYGRQLAQFFPALLLQPGAWDLEAEVLWTAAAHRKRLFVHSQMGLKGHYPDTGAWKSRELEWLEERVAKAGDGWTLDAEVEPLRLAGRTLFLPDGRLHKDGKSVWIEILGYWRGDALRRRADALANAEAGPYILAVPRKLSADAAILEDLGVSVLPFTQAIPLRELLALAERVAR